MQFNQGAADLWNADSPYGGRPDEVDDDILRANIGGDGRMDGAESACPTTLGWMERSGFPPARE